jgi:ATP-binding cassette subfamily C protein
MLKKIFDLLKKDQKKNFFYSQILFFIQGILEAVGVASVIPLIYSLTISNKADLINKFYFLESFLKNFELQQIQILFIIFFYIYIVVLNFLISLNFIINEKQTTRLYIVIFERLLKQFLLFNPNSFNKYGVSDKINTLTYDLQQSTTYIFRSIIRNFSKLYSLIFIIVTMFIIDFNKTTIFSIFFVTTYYLVFLRFGKKLKEIGKNTSIKNLKIIKNAKDIFNNLKIIRIDNLISEASIDLIDNGKNWTKSQENLQINTFLLKVIIEVIAISSIIFLIFYMTINSQSDQIFTTLGFFIYAFYRAFPNMQSIFGAYVAYVGWKKVLVKIIEKLNQNYQNIELKNEKVLFNQKITVNNVFYKYEDDETLVLENINLEIKKKTIIGIKGSSGSGKTTFVDILSGVKFPNKGNIKIDENILNFNNLKSWFSKISYVPQKLFLINDSIKNNIIINNKNISSRDLSKILKAVNLENLEETKTNLNLEKIVNELNSNLSGGEIQRLGIARALVKNPDLIILDESTSGLQLEMEVRILENIKNLFPEITIILITHRDKSLEICDKVIRF